MFRPQNDIFLADTENFGHKNRSAKQFNSERKFNVRKQALGEIKNVIHNHMAITPIKGITKIPPKAINTDLIKLQNKVQKRELPKEVGKAPRQLRSIQLFATNKVEEPGTRDAPTSNTCNEKCSKSLEEMWSEMNVLEPEILERLVDGNDDIENSFDFLDSYMPPTMCEDDFDLDYELDGTYYMDEEKQFAELTDTDDLVLPNALAWFDDL